MRGYDRLRRRLTPGGVVGPELQEGLLPRRPGPPAPVAGTTQGGGPAPERLPILLPPVNFPPDGAYPVDEIGDANIAPAGTAPLVTIFVPEGRSLRVAAIGFGADDETALRFLTWNLSAADAAIPGYYNVPATIGTIRSPSEVVVVVPGRPTMLVLTATASALAMVTYRYLARVRGWIYAERDQG